MANAETTSLFSSDELDEVARKAGDDAQFDGDFEDLNEFGGDYEEESNESVDELIGRLKNEKELDIFQDVGERLAKADMIVSYQVKKNGKFYTTTEHPYSWERLQKDHCKQEGARFSITAKNPDTGAYIKTQTQNVDRLPDNGTPNVESSSQERGLSTQELLAMFQQSEEKAKREAGEKAKSERETMLSLMQMLKPEKSDNTEVLKMMSEQSNQSTQTMVAMMTAMMQNKPQDNSSETLKFMMQMQQSQQDKTERLIEKMQENTNRVLEQVMVAASSKEEPEFRTAEIMQMIDRARNDGFEQFSTMNQLAEAKAQERFSDKNKEPEGITETILKSLAPALASGMMAGRGAPQQMPQLPNPQQQGSVSRPQAQAANNRQVRPQNGVTANQSKAGATRQASQGRQNGTPNRSSSQGGVSGFPSAKKAAIKVNNEAPTKQTVEPTSQSSKMIVDEQHKAKIIEIAVPIIVSAYTSQGDIGQAVSETISAFLNSGVQMGRVNIDFGSEDIEAIIKVYNLDESMSVLLREYYEKLQGEVSRQYPKNG